MMVLVTGGSGSGKSAYAENLVMDLSEGGQLQKYYLATMQIFEEEGRRKVERHRALREGKCFLTIEQPTNIHRALDKMEEGERICLLECLSNLTANEMFSGEETESSEAVAKKIVNGIRRLKQEMKHVIVVTNNVFEDGIAYDTSTAEYIRVLGRINRELAVMAEEVVEVVAGIPIIIKKYTGKETVRCI